MVTKRMESWEVSDFQHEFRSLAEKSSDETFRTKFSALADELEPFGREFIHESAGCGHDLSAMVEELHGIAARDRYCDRDRGFQKECESLYHDVDRAVGHAQQLRSTCFV